MGRLDDDLASMLEKLGVDEDIDVLVYPRQGAGPEGLDALEQLLRDQQTAGTLRYNLLHLAGCAAVQARKPALLKLAGHESVGRVAANPRFTAR